MAGLLVPRGCRSEPVLTGVTEMMMQGLTPVAQPTGGREPGTPVRPQQGSVVTCPTGHCPF